MSTNFDTDDALKKAYARALLARVDKDEFAAALDLLGKDRSLDALYLSKTYPFDSVVVAEIERILASPDEHLGVLPDKAETARSVWERANNPLKPIAAKDYVAAMKLYADIRGYITKPDTTINNVNNNAPTVIRRVIVRPGA